VTEAQQAGEIDQDVDPEQLAWELDSLLGGVNAGFKSGEGDQAIERGRRAIRDRLMRATTPVASPLA
jgi:tetracycline repressor-like protein